jgi:Zn-dependent metalloprotease
MKKYLLLALLTFLSFSLFSQVYQGSDASKLIAGTETLRYISNFENPAFIKFRSDSNPYYSELSQWLKNTFKVSDDCGYIILSTEKDELQITHYRCQQTYQGIPLREGMFNVHVKDGKIESINGKFFSEINITNSLAQSESNALNAALHFVNAQKYMWEEPGNENWLKTFTSNPDATYYPKAETILLYIAETKSFKYAYEFDIYATQPLSRQDVFVNASTSEIIKSLKTIHFTNVEGTAVTKYSGIQTIKTDSLSPASFRLRDNSRGNGVNTYNLLNQSDYNSAVDFSDADNYWNNVNAQLDEAAGDAHWGAEMTYDYYFTNFGRNSIDNNGFALNSYIHYNTSYANAFWDGQRMTYGDGSNNNPFTALDICGHEITHGLDSYTANLDYAEESGALNEGFSDIFGTAIEFYAKPTMANWTCGENIGMIIRNLQNPNAEQNPDTYLGTYWDPNQEVHQNSTVLSHWYYRVCMGGSGTNDIGNSFSVTGIGMTKASKIAYRMLNYYLINTSDYAEARFYGIQAATDLYGGCTPEVEAVTNAFYAVGIGSIYVPNVVADFNAQNNTSCSIPLTVQFQNLSSNATTYLWDFGDGTTSTLVNPTHTYNSASNFNVKLKGYSTGCGTDSIIYNNFVSISSANSNYAVMPVSGTLSPLTCCKGTLFDSGENDDYTNNTDGQITISSVGAATLSLTFSAFDFESGYDYLYIYDGPNTSSPLIGQYSGSSLPGGGIINSTGGSITLRQTTDQGVVGSGFKLTWQCSAPTSPPICNFMASTTNSCTGVINFTDQSANGASSWLWNFGDGSTSTLQHPVHAYMTNGVYSVKLKSTNNFGSDSIIKISYVTISGMPVNPAVSPIISCIGSSATLTSSGSGKIEWYDLPTGGNLLDTGNVYITSPLVSGAEFYVQDRIATPDLYGGKPDNTGSGGYFGNASSIHYLIFNSFTPFTLSSVKVYANGANDRTIQLRDSNQAVLQSLTVNIPDGESRVTLNFNVPVGQKMQLVATGAPYLYRNNSGSASYPYSLPGILSIIESSASLPPTNVFKNYYYFYDWEVKEEECISPRIPYPLTVLDCSGINEIDAQLFSVYPNPADDKLTIELKSSITGYAKIYVTDLIGKTVYSSAFTSIESRQLSIDISSFNTGVYLINLITNDQKHVEKLIIK